MSNHSKTQDPAGEPTEKPGKQPAPAPTRPVDTPGPQPEDASSEFIVRFDPTVIANSRPVVVPTPDGGLEVRILLENQMHSQDVRVAEAEPSTGALKRVSVEVSAIPKK